MTDQAERDALERNMPHVMVGEGENYLVVHRVLAHALLNTGHSNLFKILNESEKEKATAPERRIVKKNSHAQACYFYGCNDNSHTAWWLLNKMHFIYTLCYTREEPDRVSCIVRYSVCQERDSSIMDDLYSLSCRVASTLYWESDTIFRTPRCSSRQE